MGGHCRRGTTVVTAGAETSETRLDGAEAHELAARMRARREIEKAGPRTRRDRLALRECRRDGARRGRSSRRAAAPDRRRRGRPSGRRWSCRRSTSLTCRLAQSSAFQFLIESPTTSAWFIWLSASSHSGSAVLEVGEARVDDFHADEGIAHGGERLVAPDRLRCGPRCRARCGRRSRPRRRSCASPCRRTRAGDGTSAPASSGAGLGSAVGVRAPTFQPATGPVACGHAVLDGIDRSAIRQRERRRHLDGRCAALRAGCCTAWEMS